MIESSTILYYYDTNFIWYNYPNIDSTTINTVLLTPTNKSKAKQYNERPSQNRTDDIDEDS